MNEYIRSRLHMSHISFTDLETAPLSDPRRTKSTPERQIDQISLEDGPDSILFVRRGQLRATERLRFVEQASRKRSEPAISWGPEGSPLQTVMNVARGRKGMGRMRAFVCCCSGRKKRGGGTILIDFACVLLTPCRPPTHAAGMGLL